ncbi:hypothetical protein E4U56_007779 [Claviceps arundinis]|uniref:Uncharacterized protein n=1 Tax=Claviceps arundinis TaxID=1623583 RepID=A0A9P7SSM8_9HYPO|nr:hypothetical protein E4U56_007779 [Claviceps arundinis]
MSFMDGMQSHLGTEFVDGTEPIEELLDAVASGMHPNAVCAEMFHHTSVIPDYPISSDNRFAYVIRTDELALEDVEKPQYLGTARMAFESFYPGIKRSRYRKFIRRSQTTAGYVAIWTNTRPSTRAAIVAEI